jgi:[glutamine synthetase] adenylyltransferase / [glutamine synthetase]-adenylyl-L-tyrosine phosphorylase
VFDTEFNISTNPDNFPAQEASLPRVYHKDDVSRGWQEWNELAKKQDDKHLADWMMAVAENRHHWHRLISSVFASSPYLTRLCQLYPDLLYYASQHGVQAGYERIVSGLTGACQDTDVQAVLMRELRIAKGQMALLVALADIGGQWSLEQVTGALSSFASLCLSIAVDFVLRTAHKRGEIELQDIATPSQDSGIIILGMGKLGGEELNYSSDIDLIIIFEPGKLGYKGRQTEQHFMNKLAHELVSIMQERTAQGYVFRTDLRLRPDPASTPPAITIDAAYYYYESVGQNWERAAMIKARPVAGDIKAGERFLKALSPFMWRRSLDFASINDIHSIKRQMDSLRSKDIVLKGHNVKLGVGGIREIEFYAQIHQLIWGGRMPVLRSKATCDTLRLLQENNLIDDQAEHTMLEAYAYLRKLEHRLQMVADEQTHTLPDSEEGIEKIACFMGYDAKADFEADLLDRLRAVHDIYTNSFQTAEKLGDEGNLVFTGSNHDPETLATLNKMGYSSPETISEIVMGWHHGSRRATRTKRARELLTELMPLILKRLSETANPDSAFLKFNEFLSKLPAGVQLFSLFNVNPHLLDLIADIMGSAPTLADHLSRAPHMLDAVLHADFYGPLPSREFLEEQLGEMLLAYDDYEGRLDALRRFRNEKRFQAGVQLLKSMITAQQAGQFLSLLADLMIKKATKLVTEEFSKTYGQIEGSRFAVIALGKLGSQEMTFSSDIDLVFAYDVPDFDAVSTGEKGFSASVYFNRLSQRLLNALSAMGREGRLYEVDTRLRPSGAQGLMAVSTIALEHYFDELAWTFEFMAFTKARVVYGETSLKEELDVFILRQIGRERNEEKLKADVADMRRKIDGEHHTENPWDIKYVRGGLMDVDFIAQYLVLLHGAHISGGKSGCAADVFRWLEHGNKLAPEIARELIEADQFLGQIFNMLRLCCDRKYDESTAPQGLKKLLVACVKEDSYESLRSRLIAVEQIIFQHYNALLGSSGRA